MLGPFSEDRFVLEEVGFAMVFLAGRLRLAQAGLGESETDSLLHWALEREFARDQRPCKSQMGGG